MSVISEALGDHLVTNAADLRAEEQAEHERRIDGYLQNRYAIHAPDGDALGDYLRVLDFDPAEDIEIGLDDEGNALVETVSDRLWNYAEREGLLWTGDDDEGVVLFVKRDLATEDLFRTAHRAEYPEVKFFPACAGLELLDLAACFHRAGFDLDGFRPVAAPLWTTEELTEDMIDAATPNAPFEPVRPAGELPPELEVLDWSKRSEPRPERVYLEHLLIALGQVTKFTAGSGVGKTLFLGNCALSWSLQRSMLDVDGHKPRQLDGPIRVLYIDGEVGEDWWFEYLDKMAAPLELPHLLVKSFPDWPPLTTDAGARLFWELVEHHKPDVVILDTLSSFIDGDENDSSTWIAFDNRITLPLKARGMTAIYADHTGKNAELGARGSSAKKSKIDVEWSMESSPKGSNGLVLRNLKARTGKLPDTVRLLRKDNPLTHTRSGTEAGPTGPLRFVSESGEPVDPKVAEVVRVLDELKINPKTGFPTVSKRLRSEGDVSARDDVIRAAITYRRERDES